MANSASGAEVIADQALSPPASETGPVMTFPSPAPSARIVPRFQSALNAALWQNHVPVLSELSVVNLSDEPLGDVEIELSCQPPVLRHRPWRLSALGPGRVRMFDELDVAVDGPFLSGRSEAIRGTASLTARSGGEVVAEFAQDIRILAMNEAVTGVVKKLSAMVLSLASPTDPTEGRLPASA